MTSSHSNAHAAHEANWLDTWWPLLVILFGLIFFTTLISWKPGDRGVDEPAVKKPAVPNNH